MLGNRQYCYPLTISDYSTRYLIGCEGVKSTKADLAFTVFESAFREFGLPARSAPTTAYRSPPAMRSSV